MLVITFVLVRSVAETLVANNGFGLNTHREISLWFKSLILLQ